MPEQLGQSTAILDFYVKPTFNGRPASAGNGAMIALEARSQKQVRDLHSAALAAGGFDEGQSGFRDLYGPHLMLAAFATLKATKSHCSPTNRANLDERVSAG